MSSLHNQPVVEDIVSAFETTQTQPWSIFNGKLGSIPIKDCKKRNVFKSENPIELSDEDIPVFGFVPRLEKLMLVSCNKCSMVVKRECIHYHYKRRHNNPENDNFSLERFILPNAKINKHKKQRINIRKTPDKKIIDGEIIDPVVQEIKTEFDQLEFERLLEINRLKIKQENEINYVNEHDNNLPTKSCNPSINSNAFDWRLKPLNAQVHYADHKINDILSDNNNDFNKLSSIVSPVNIKELQNNKCLENVLNNENNINYVTSSSEFSVKSFDLNESEKSKIDVDYSNFICDINIKNKGITNTFKNKNDQMPSELQSINKEILSTNDTFPNIKNDKNSDVFINCNQSPILSIKKEIDDIIDNSKISTKLLDNKEFGTFNTSYKYLNVTNDESSIGSNSSYQSSAPLIHVKREFKITPETKYSDVKVKEEYDENNDDSSIMYYQNLHEFPNNTEQTKYFTPIYKHLNIIHDESCLTKSLEIKNEFKIASSTKLIHDINIKKEYDEDNENNDKSRIEQLPLELINNNTQTKCSPTNKYSDEIIKEENDEIDDKYKIVKIQFLSELPNSETKTKHVLSNIYSDTFGVKEENYNNCNKSKIVLSQLLNSEAKTEYSSNNKYSKVMMNKYYNDNVSGNGNLTISPFNIKKEIELPQNNKYITLINNKRPNDSINSYNQADHIKKSKSPSININPNDILVDDGDNCDDNPKYEYYQLSTGCHENLECISYRELNIESDNEDNCEITDNYSLTFKEHNNEEKTKFVSNYEYSDNEDPDDDVFTDYDQSQILSSLHNKEELKHIPIIEYSDIMIDNNNIVSNFENEYYELTTGLLNNNKQITSLDSKEKTEPKDKYSDLTLDNNTNDSVSSSDQSTTPSKESKSTQTDWFSNQINYKQFIDPITKIDELIVESLGIVNDKTKCTQTDTVFDCKDCCKITKILIDGYIPLNSEIVEDLIKSYTPSRNGPKDELDENFTNSFIPINSNAQKINNNTSIPSSTRGSELLNSDHNHCVSNGLHYLSSFQPTFWSPKNLADKSKQEYIYHRNGSTYIDKNYVISKNHLKKTVDEKIVFSKNCKSIPRAYNHLIAKVKKNMKKRLGEQVASDKENRSLLITGHFKKLKRVEFVKRKVIYSDESDNNDNIDE